MNPATMTEVPDPERYLSYAHFLYREAALLDRNELEAWLELLTDDVEYRMPARITRERKRPDSAIAENSFHFDEDWNSLQARVDRFQSEFAWSENPPSRTSRYVTNILPAPQSETEEGPEADVMNTLFCYRIKSDRAEPDLLTCHREDTLRRTEDEWKLARRRILPTQSTLDTESLSYFL
jgi:3-phenylpropionate/cinnamic acid dioxygenase small subunit